ncbi:unnamed protein product [Paramecium pentaurelia]|uniref:Transmembrane protein n=1 Tax=Paramecium pentaurelia TaxID=43138 RepID=A0A8S1T2J3_9CILI|nr:unnamed protein product [Paramecium pentaurelia]
MEFQKWKNQVFIDFLWTQQMDLVFIIQQEIKFLYFMFWRQKFRCWKNQNFNDWISLEPYKKHTDWVMCLVMNKNEIYSFLEVVIIQQKYGSLILIKMNQHFFIHQINIIIMLFRQVQINQRIISIMCIREELDYYLGKKRKNTYEFKYFVRIPFIYKQSIYNYRLKDSFITGNSFISTTGDQGIDMIYFFELIEGIYQEIQHKSIQLMNNDQDYDEYFFSIIYNKQRNLILVRHKSQIYLIRNINNGNFKIVDQLNCNTSDIYWTITDNGQYFVFWIVKIMDFQFMNYKVNENSLIFIYIEIYIFLMTPSNYEKQLHQQVFMALFISTYKIYIQILIFTSFNYLNLRIQNQVSNIDFILLFELEKYCNSNRFY